MAIKIFTTGNPRDVVAKTNSLICLAGGGQDDLWSEGWSAMLEAAGGGDVVVIRAGGDRGGYESWIYNDEGSHGFPRVNSITTISLENAKDANRSDVEKLILNAEMVFFAGGDQSKYINWFRDSKLAAAVDYVMNKKKIPIGGTSAGMALLAGIDYAANYSSPSDRDGLVTSADVLKDPTGHFVSLDRSVLTPPYLNQVVTDTHFSQRDRHGRLLGFMARAVYNNYGDIFCNNVKGIGADEGTAVCYTESGVARVYGAGKVFFLIGNAPIEKIVAGSSLIWNAEKLAVSTYVIDGSQFLTAQFDLNLWIGSGGAHEFWYNAEP